MRADLVLVENMADSRQKAKELIETGSGAVSRWRPC